MSPAESKDAQAEAQTPLHAGLPPRPQLPSEKPRHALTLYTSNGQALPPIVDTGASGPFLPQPGDWLCGQCNFTNWRRRSSCRQCGQAFQLNEAAFEPAPLQQMISEIDTLVIGSPSSPTFGQPIMPPPFYVWPAHHHPYLNLGSPCAPPMFDFAPTEYALFEQSPPLSPPAQWQYYAPQHF